MNLSGRGNHNILGVSFEGITSKRERIGPIFSSFNPFPSMPSVATDDRKQFQCRNILTKLDQYFWNSTDTKTPFSFFLSTKIAWHSPFKMGIPLHRSY